MTPHVRPLGATTVKRAPLPRAPVAQAVDTLIARVRRRALAEATRRKWSELMARACAIRAAGGGTADQFDQAAELYAAGVVASALREVEA